MGPVRPSEVDPNGIAYSSPGFPNPGQSVNPLIINRLQGFRPDLVVALLYTTHSGLKSGGSGVDPGFGNPGLKYGILSGFTSSYALRAPVTPEADANCQNYSVRANPDSSTT